MFRVRGVFASSNIKKFIEIEYVSSFMFLLET